MRNFVIAALLSAAVAAPLAAQNAAAPAQPAQPAPGSTPADIARAGVIFRTFSLAINSDKVGNTVKGQLISCLYNNPMRRLSVATGNAIAKNSSLDAKKPEHVYAVAAQLCGVRSQQSAAGQAAPAQPAQAGR